MAREKRIVCEGSIFHIISRGNNREYILSNPKHKSFLLKQIKEYNVVFAFELLAYVIMDNHYHLLIKTNKTPISEIMFNINNVLSKYLTRELDKKGHVLEKGFTYKLVTTDTYIIWLLRYIHRNPIRAHICNDIDDYRWSSHYFYKRGYNSFVNTNFILNILSPNKAAAQMLYNGLVNFTGNNINEDIVLSDIKLKYKLQDTSLLPDVPEKYQEEIHLKVPRKSFNDILELLNLDKEQKKLLVSGSKKHSITDCKIQFIDEALKNKYTYNEIASFLKVKYSAISMLLSRHNK